MWGFLNLLKLKKRVNFIFYIKKGDELSHRVIKNILQLALSGRRSPGRRMGLGVAGLFLGLAGVGCLFPNFGEQTGPALALPDLDEDGQAERLVVTHSRRHGTLLRLHSTNKGGHDHLMLPLPVAPEGEFRGNSPWWLDSDRGERVLDVRLIKGAHRPELLVVAGEQAKRYIFIEKGFLKLDAHEVIPGFSAGILMLGDSRETLESINGPVSLDGTWQVPIATPITMHIVLDPKGYLTRVTTQSPRMQIANTWGVGSPLGALAARYPGTWQGENWASPRYGLRIKRDETGRVLGLSVSRPWSAQSPPNR